MEVSSVVFDWATVKDDQLSNFWVLSFSDMANFDLYVESTNLPLFNTKAEKIPELNINIPDGMEDYRTVSITYRETVDFQGMKYHQRWLESLYDLKNRTVKKSYHSSKKNATIKFVSPYTVNSVGAGGKPKQNASFELVNMLFTGFEDIQLNSTDGGPLMITCQYEIEQIIPNFTRI